MVLIHFTFLNSTKLNFANTGQTITSLRNS